MPVNSTLYPKNELNSRQTAEAKATAWKHALRHCGGPSFIVGLARSAAGKIMEIYNSGDFATESKENGSPLTDADLAAAAIIERGLRDHSDLPVVCEESVTADKDPGEIFWLVDPLDGTKEFLHRNGEFTVNIALVSHGIPVFGVIAIPATGEVYVGLKGEGAHKLVGNVPSSISNLRSSGNLIAAVSRSHAATSISRYLSSLGVTQSIECGSAIKFCRVAEGSADLYVRFGRTMEWDTAAGHVIVEEAGCKLIQSASGEALKYGKAGFANPSFIVARGDLNLPLSAD